MNRDLSAGKVRVKKYIQEVKKGLYTQLHVLTPSTTPPTPPFPPLNPTTPPNHDPNKCPAPQLLSTPKSPSSFHRSSTKLNTALLPPALVTIPLIATSCSIFPGTAAPFASPALGHPVSRLYASKPGQIFARMASSEATKAPALEASMAELKKGWMFAAARSRTGQRVVACCTRMLRGSVVVMGPK